MRRFVLGVLAAVLFGALAPAQAADLPVKAPPVPVVPPITWTGFYVGINGGYSWGRWDNDGLASTTDARLDGWLGGVQAGYNWQFDQRWVFGFEADIQYTNEKDSEDPGLITTTDTPGGPPPFVDPLAFHTIATTTFANKWDFPWFATFRGRLGYLVDPSLLLYVTGGLAVGEFKFTSQASTVSRTFRGPIGTTTNPVTLPILVVGPSLSESVTRAGWTAGVGGEKKITDHWSFKVEYLYLDFGRHNFLTGTISSTSVRLRDHIARIGLNYKF
jgi:outer membrane immunogenic protein